MKVVHEMIGEGVITTIGDGTLHGNKKVEMEFSVNEGNKNTKIKRWVDKQTLQEQVCVMMIWRAKR